MFGNNGSSKNSKSSKKSARSSPAQPGSLSINSIVQGTEVEGKLSAENDIRIDGSIKGSLSCKGKVIIGPSGSVEGDITCHNAVIEGIFEGILDVKETLNVRETATISGEINTDKLIVQSGAVFNVSCKMGGKEIKHLGDDARRNRGEEKKSGDRKEGQREKDVLSFVNE